MAGSLPNLKHMELFTKIYGKISDRDVSLNAVARELMRSPSTISECISELESYYRKPFVHTAHGVARPTREATAAVATFEHILKLARSLSESDATGQLEIRIASTPSLRHRLFRGPVAALMWWLKTCRGGTHARVRVVVDAFDHNTLVRRVAERGVTAYHWGVCWELPGTGSHPYLKFQDIALEHGARGVCSTPVVALTSHLTYGGQTDELKALFRKGRTIETSELSAHLPTSRLAILYSEPEDRLRQVVKSGHNAETAIRVHQYEEALHHVQSTDADLAIVPGWYRYRHHVAWAGLLQDGSVVTRQIQLVMRQVEADERHERDAVSAWPEPVKAFYVISRLFLSDPKFAPAIFCSDGVSAGKSSQKASQTAGHDPIHEAIPPEKIALWVDENKDRIRREIQVLT